MPSNETRERMKAIVRKACKTKTLYTDVNVNGKKFKIDNRSLAGELERVRDTIVETNQANRNSTEDSNEVRNSNCGNDYSIRNYLGYQTLKKTLFDEWREYIRLSNRLVAEKETERKNADKNIQTYFENNSNEL